jgi:hypothetical protein
VILNFSKPGATVSIRADAVEDHTHVIINISEF